MKRRVVFILTLDLRTTKKKMIYLAADHGGYILKNILVEYLKSKNISCKDMGPHLYEAEDDYPDFIIPAAERVASEAGSLGIILGGSGTGEALAANKVKGIRAALYYGGPVSIVMGSKIHTNANVLSLGAKHLTEEEAKNVVQLWLDTQFTEEERHVRRIEKVSNYENGSSF